MVVHIEGTEEATLRVIKQLPGAVVLLSANEYRVKYASDTYRAFLPESFKDKDLVGVRFIDYVAGGENNPSYAAICRISETGMWEEMKDYKITNADGRQFCVDWVGSPIANGTDRWDVLLQPKDITDRVRIREELMASKDKLAIGMDLAKLAHWDYDVRTDRFFFDDRFYALYGTTAEKEGGHYMSGEQYVSSFIPKEEAVAASKFIQHVLSPVNKDDYPQYEHKIHRRDGEIRHIIVRIHIIRDESGRAMRTHGVNQDITEMKKAEEALRRSEERFKQVAENASEFIWEVDGDGIYSYCSPAVRDIMGYSPEELVGKMHFYDLFAPQHRDVLTDGAFTRIFKKESIQGLININLHRDGHEVILETSGVPVLGEDGTLLGYRGVDRDITDHKRAEERLREANETLEEKVVERTRELAESEEKFFKAFHGSAAATYIARLSDGKIMDVNEQGLKLLDYRRDELIGRTTTEMHIWQSAKDHRQVVDELKRGVSISNREIQIRRKNGEIRTALQSSNFIELNGEGVMLFSLVDITEQVEGRRRIEELAILTEAERARLRTILSTLPVGVIIIDAEGREVERNQQADAIWGRPTTLPEGLEDYGVFKGWWADTGIKLKPQDWAVSRALSKGETSIGEFIDIERFDGTRGTIILASAPLRDPKGKTTGAVAVFQDITRQRRLEHEAIEAKERAEVYLDLLTHDISNLNAAAVGYLQLIEERGLIEGKDAKLVSKPMDALNSITELIDNVRMLQRVEAHDSRQSLVDLGFLLEDVFEQYTDLPNKNITLNYKVQLKRMVMANELLKEVFTNIVGNAVKHSEGAVQIDILLTKTYESGREYHKVVVEDDGPGIPDDMKSKVFARMHRGSRRTGGSGLGLYIVRRLVEEFNGRVWVEDRVAGDYSKGARFVVLLPVASG